MSASKKAKDAGLPGLLVVSEMTGVSMQTLHNWHGNPKKQQLFAVLLAGCVAMRKQQQGIA